jgi:hypothetical protein
MPRARLSGYLSRASSCMTGAGFISFMPLLKSSINTGSALMIRPAQTIFFETGAVGADVPHRLSFKTLLLWLAYLAVQTLGIDSVALAQAP